MTHRNYGFYAGVLLLLFTLLIPGAFAATDAQTGYIVVGIAPVAQFNAYYGYTSLPATVKFADTSLGTTPMTYQWDFGDGSTSTEQNPTHIYSQKGIYTIKLTVTNAYGTSTAIKKDYVSIGLGPKPEFSANPLSGNAPMAVKFTDLSQGQPTKWVWDFGDGTGSAEKDPVHTYWTAGIYNVVLTVTNDFGMNDVVKSRYITVIGQLTSKFSADPGSGRAPLAVKFTDRSLGSPTAWNWDFGDGIQSADQNPVHSFAAGGAYDVKLTVSRDGDSDTSTQVINVGGVPVADFSGNPISVNPGEPVRFTDKTANSPTAWSWDFGDTATSTDQNPAHTYKIKGIYTISLTARNDNGKDTETKKNYINVGIGPVADFIPSVSPYEQSRIPQNVRFLDKSAGNPTSWYWDFGDGSTSTLQNPKHAYVSEGLYSVSLTAKNDFGENTKVIKDIIWVGKGPAVDFMADKTTVGVGRIVMFTDLSSNAPTNWVWDFGDGTTGNGQNPDHAYRATGVYDVTLTAYNPSTSNSVTKNQYITVLNLPRADFMADKTRGGAPMNVQFTDTSAGSPTSWKWDFGDGASSTERNPKHQYTALGSYTVTLIASNPNGQDTTSKTNYIVTTLAPVADFRVDQRIGKAPFIVQFKDLSTGNPTKWNWEFGDGTTSPEQNPRHIYAVEGAYDVRLTATNEYGSDTVFKTGSSAETAAPVITPAVVTTAATQAAHTVVATQAPPTTTAPVSLFAGLGAAAIAFVAIASAKRK